MDRQWRHGSAGSRAARELVYRLEEMQEYLRQGRLNELKSLCEGRRWRDGIDVAAVPLPVQVDVQRLVDEAFVALHDPVDTEAAWSMLRSAVRKLRKG
jgi:hypothetical protein